MAEVVLLDALRLTAPSGKILLMGVLDPGTLDNVLDDDYQREKLPVTSVDKWKKALQSGEVPSLVLGMRGDRWGRQGNKWVLHDTTYVIDGLQRLTAARSILAEGVPPFLLVTIHMGTDRRYERELFLRLNSTQRKVGANVLLRNVREREPSVAVLFSYTDFEQSPLYNRVTWAQVARKGDLMTAVMLMRVSGIIHARFGATQYTQMAALLGGLSQVVEDIRAERFGENVMAFFDLIEHTWGLSQLETKRGALHLKLCWLLTLGRIIAEHRNFWQDDRLVVPTWARDKLANFKITEPVMIESISTYGRVSEPLTEQMVRHLNTKRPHDPLVKF